MGVVEGSVKAPAPIYPCICGFICDRESRMKTHRKSCISWKNRFDPIQIMIERRSKTTGIPLKVYERCPFCERNVGHSEYCPNSIPEKARRDRLIKNGIDLFFFEIFLRLLAQRYRVYM